MIINYQCYNCKRRFSIISLNLPYSSSVSCHYCKSTDVKRIFTDELIKEIKKI